MRYLRYIPILLVIVACSKEKPAAETSGDSASSSSAAAPATSSATPAPADSAARIRSLGPAKVDFDVPEGWKSEYGGPNKVTLMSPDSTVEIAFQVVQPEHVKEMAILLRKALESLPAFHSDTVTTTKKNGVTVIEEIGTAKRDGVPFAWTLVTVLASKPIIFSMYGSKADVDRHRGEYEKMVESIRSSTRN